MRWYWIWGVYFVVSFPLLMFLSKVVTRPGGLLHGMPAEHAFGYLVGVGNLTVGILAVLLDRRLRRHRPKK